MDVRRKEYVSISLVEGPMQFSKSTRMKEVRVRVAAKKTGKHKHKGYTKTVYKTKKGK